MDLVLHHQQAEITTPSQKIFVRTNTVHQGIFGQMFTYFSQRDREKKDRQSKADLSQSQSIHAGRIVCRSVGSGSQVNILQTESNHLVSPIAQLLLLLPAAAVLPCAVWVERVSIVQPNHLCSHEVRTSCSDTTLASDTRRDERCHYTARALLSSISTPALAQQHWHPHHHQQQHHQHQ